MGLARTRSAQAIDSRNDAGTDEIHLHHVFWEGTTRWPIVPSLVAGPALCRSRYDEPAEPLTQVDVSAAGLCRRAIADKPTTAEIGAIDFT